MPIRRPWLPVMLAIGWLTIGVTSAVAGQAPSQSPPGTPPPPPPTLEGAGELSFVATSGNTSTDTIGLASELIYRPLPWVLDSKVGFIRTEANSVLNAQSLTASSRLSRDLSPKAALFVQYDFLKNTFAGISQRHTVAAGLTYKPVTDTRNTVELDVGLGYASETPVGLPRTQTGTFLGGGSYKLKISDTSEFAEDARIVASLSRGADWRFDNSAGVTAKLTAKLSLKVSDVIHVVNLPTPGFKKTDTIASAALVAKF